ncbi:glycosyltransferase family 39 protein [Candidatus Woesearchaeota archaeon]|nr:glycosyltransferase family 39 protein [Candidatus Woesearchaeota archaeon]
MGWGKDNRFFIYIFTIALVVKLVFLLDFHEIWWDTAVYVGMGKYLFSLGNAGLWEHIRPIFLPIILGLAWFLKLNPVVFGRILEFILSLASIVLFYFLAEHYFNKKTAIFAVIIFAFSSIVLQMTYHVYTETIVLFIILLSLFLFEKEYFFWAGFLVGLAFLSKFPAAMFLLPFLIMLFLRFEFKHSAKLIAGFAIPAGIFLIFNFFMYSSPLLPLIDARVVISQVMGCNFFRKFDWWFYLAKLFEENWFHLFAFPGLYLFVKKYHFKHLTPALFLFVPLIYFTGLACRDYRYLILFLPFVAMFSGSGIDFVFKKQKHFRWVLIALLCFSVFQGANFIITKEIAVNPEYNQDYLNFLEDKSPVGEVWVSHPNPVIYSDASIKKIYYTDFNSDASTLFYNYLKTKDYKIQYVFLDNCGGGIMCYPANEKCKQDKNKTIEFLNKNFELAFDDNYGLCYYRVYENPLF